MASVTRIRASSIIVVNKKAEIVRVYLPPDANTLLWVTDHCLRSWDRINVIVAGKQPEAQWLDMDSAIKHCTQGIGIWPWASNDQDSQPDVVMGCCRRCADAGGDGRGRPDAPATARAAGPRRERRRPDDPAAERSSIRTGCRTPISTRCSPRDTPMIFAFHGYPSLIHPWSTSAPTTPTSHVRGFMEEGTTTTPFDMVVRNRLDRFHLVADVIDRVPSLVRRPCMRSRRSATS